VSLSIYFLFRKTWSWRTTCQSSQDERGSEIKLKKKKSRHNQDYKECNLLRTFRNVSLERQWQVIPLPPRRRIGLLCQTRKRYATSILDLPSLSQKLLSCSISIKKHSGCQWPTQNACLSVSVTCLSFRIWDACQNHQAGKIADKQKGWVMSRWIPTASLSLILNSVISI
jgi:hypothetical protein